MAYSNSYMFLGIGLFVILSSQALANHQPHIYDGVQDDKNGIDYVKDQKNGEALDDQNVDLEYVKAHKTEEALAEQMVLEYTKAQQFAEALDDQKSQEYVHKFAACESPPNPLTDHKINEEALDDQKSQEYAKAKKFFAACESPPHPLTNLKINEETLDDQKSQEYVKNVKYAASENSKPLTDLEINDASENSKSLTGLEINAASENSKPLTGLEINESKLDWRSFHAKYPWIKKNGHKSIPGSRKLLNDIANDQLGGLSQQI